MLFTFDKGGTQPIVQREGTSKKGVGLASKRGYVEGGMTLCISINVNFIEVILTIKPLEQDNPMIGRLCSTNLA